MKNTRTLEVAETRQGTPPHRARAPVGVSASRALAGTLLALLIWMPSLAGATHDGSGWYSDAGLDTPDPPGTATAWGPNLTHGGPDGPAEPNYGDSRPGGDKNANRQTPAGGRADAWGNRTYAPICQSPGTYVNDAEPHLGELLEDTLQDAPNRYVFREDVGDVSEARDGDAAPALFLDQVWLTFYPVGINFNALLQGEDEDNSGYADYAEAWSDNTIEATIEGVRGNPPPPTLVPRAPRAFVATEALPGTSLVWLGNWTDGADAAGGGGYRDNVINLTGVDATHNNPEWGPWRGAAPRLRGFFDPYGFDAVHTDPSDGLGTTLGALQAATATPPPIDPDEPGNDFQNNWTNYAIGRWDYAWDPANATALVDGIAQGLAQFLARPADLNSTLGNHCQIELDYYQRGDGRYESTSLYFVDDVPHGQLTLVTWFDADGDNRTWNGTASWWGSDLGDRVDVDQYVCLGAPCGKGEGELDYDGDGLGDEWTEYWRQRAEAWVWALDDLDADGLHNLDEYRWQLIPYCLPDLENCRDYERDPANGTGGDQWWDGAEVAYWNDPSNDAGLSADDYAFYDPDRALDTDGDGARNVDDPDADNDTLLDGDEALTIGSYPEHADSDCALEDAWCPAAWDTSLYDPDRPGSPGTGDGIPDAQELAAWNAIYSGAWATDFDGDGIARNLIDPDSDADRILDGDEFACAYPFPWAPPPSCTSPAAYDTDQDGLLDGGDILVAASDPEAGWPGGIVFVDAPMGRTYLGEASQRTNASRADSDGDGLLDGWEVHYGFNPLDPTDAALDPDRDAYSNLQEFTHNSSWYWGQSWRRGTDPRQWDTDADGMPDGWEVQYGLQPASPFDASGDGDADHLRNPAEYAHGRPLGWNESAAGVWEGGTFPTQWDSDVDGTSDGWEATHGFLPRDASDATQDPDGDDYTNRQEHDHARTPASLGQPWWSGTQPRQWDTDMDGMADGWEVRYQLNPQSGSDAAGDPDRDSLLNRQEYEYARPSTWNEPLRGLHRLGTHPQDWDTDNDTLPDGYEAQRALEPRDADDAPQDPDGDDYSNAQEYYHAQPAAWNLAVHGVWWGGTDVHQWDSDADGTPDGWEAEYGLDPQTGLDALGDPDRDGLSNRQEYEYARPMWWNESLQGLHRLGTHPQDWDTDNDTQPDGWEAWFGLEPRDAADAESDGDADAYPNRFEYAYARPANWSEPDQGPWWTGTDPRDPDSDGDELPDGAEALEEGTDPRAWDTDADALPDAWEARYRYAGNGTTLSPIVSDAAADPDEDSFPAPWCANDGSDYSNRAEYAHGILPAWDSRPGRLGGDGVWWNGTRPDRFTSDMDELPDGYEVCVDSDPLQADLVAVRDDDADGLDTYHEYGALTHYLLADTDGDGLCDGGRAANCTRNATVAAPGEAHDYHTSPVMGDTDGDAWTDGPESEYWDPPGAVVVPDSDGDGADNLHEADSDADGLTDWVEYGTRAQDESTDPTLYDSDRDGLRDGLEHDGWAGAINGWGRWFTSHPRLVDTDTDALNDSLEYSYGSNPRDADSDADGLGDAFEVHGWVVVAGGASRHVTSDPRFADTDADGLTDAAEQRIGTDPRDPDTDDDLLEDGAEDENADGTQQEGETNPFRADSDQDGLRDGWEAYVYGSDALELDSDDDGLADGEEVTRYGTNPALHDSDDDYLPDGEEVGAASAGGDPGRVTNPTHADSDGDGALDGAEVHFDGTDPRRADTDCDGAPDGTDPNPHYSNLAPGQVLTPSQRAACAGAGGQVAQAGADLGDLAPPSLGASVGPDNPPPEEVGLVAFDAEGTVTFWARPPESETPVTTVEVLLFLEGWVRVDANGTTAWSNATVRAELEPLDEPSESGSPYTHGIRLGLPEGLVNATAASYALTFLDANHNAATYAANVSGFLLEELAYEDDWTPVDGEDWDDPTNDTTGDASGWDYRRGATTGGVDPDLGGSWAWGLGGSGDDPGVWIWRILQPGAASLVGAWDADALAFRPPSPTSPRAPSSSLRTRRCPWTPTRRAPTCRRAGSGRA